MCIKRSISVEISIPHHRNHKFGEMISTKERKRKKLIILLLHLSGVLNSPAERPLIPSMRYNLFKHCERDVVEDFRFDTRGILKLCHIMEVPHVIRTEHRDRACAWEGMCILLYRLSYPLRYRELRKKSGRSNAALTRIFLWMVDYIHDNWKDLIYFNIKLLEERIEHYCEAISGATEMEVPIYGLIDGTKIEICRPKSKEKGQNLQKSCYSGHKQYLLLQ
jgi:hypothetical protein